MSASWGDIDHDGDPDLFVANAGYYQEMNNQLFINEGDGTFTEITSGDAVTDGGCSYGSAFADVDNDGDLDLLVANGFCNNNLEDRLYVNDGTGSFTYAPDALPDMPERCSLVPPSAILTRMVFSIWSLPIAEMQPDKHNRPTPITTMMATITTG